MPGSPVVLRRAPARNGRTWTLSGMVHGWSRQRAQVVIKMIVAASLTGLCMFILGQSSAGGSLDMAPITSPSSTLDFSNWDTGSLDTNAFFGRRTNWVNVPAAHNFISRKFSRKEDGVTHVMVTGGAGYIGSHAALRLLQDGYRVTIVDNLSRGNMGAVDILRALFPKPGHLQFLYVDLGDSQAVQEVFAKNAIDAVMHFAAVAYVGESMAEPLRYYHNITSNTLGLLEAMVKYDVKTLIYSSTCATYGEPETMPITETTPQVPINPYGKAKKMAEDIILDYSKINPELSVMILRYFNVIGSDPKGRLGEAPRPELRAHGRISGACFDAAMGQIPGLKVHGQDYKTEDGTCIRDYIHVTDLVDAHVKALKHAMPNNVGIYNVGTGKGRSVKEFVEACIKATGVNMTVSYLERRAGDYAEVYSDSSKIQRELNWTAQHLDLTETLNVAWKWRQAHPNGY